MIKDIIISLLLGILSLEADCFRECTIMEKAGLIPVISGMSFYFLLFLEDLCEKWQVRRKRIAKLRKEIDHLTNMWREKK